MLVSLRDEMDDTDQVSPRMCQFVSVKISDGPILYVAGNQSEFQGNLIEVFRFRAECPVACGIEPNITGPSTRQGCRRYSVSQRYRVNHQCPALISR